MKIKTPEQYRAQQERRNRLAKRRKTRMTDYGWRTGRIVPTDEGLNPNHAERVTNAPQAPRSDSPYLPRYIGKGHHRIKRCERYSGGCQRPTAHKGKCGARSQSETLIYGEVTKK